MGSQGYDVKFIRNDSLQMLSIDDLWSLHASVSEILLEKLNSEIVELTDNHEIASAAKPVQPL